MPVSNLAALVPTIMADTLHVRHGGGRVSSYIAKELPGLIESVKPTSASELVHWTKATHKGYFKRWRGGVLNKWMKHTAEVNGKGGEALLSLEERLTLAFLQVRAPFCSLDTPI